MRRVVCQRYYHQGREVFPEWFLHAAAVSSESAKRASAQAGKVSDGGGGASALSAAQLKALAKSMSKAAENLSVMHAVQWVYDYTDLSAAEQIPGADASRGVSAALSASDDADSGRICHLRLHENEISRI
jgi:hypothetical protein